MVKYTIYTENKNLAKIEVILNDSIIIQGYTIINTQGYWQGLKEKALKIEILLEQSHLLDYTTILKTICKKIKIVNKQEAVLLTIEKIEATFIWDYLVFYFVKCYNLTEAKKGVKNVC